MAHDSVCTDPHVTKPGCHCLNTLICFTLQAIYLQLSHSSEVVKVSDAEDSGARKPYLKLQFQFQVSKYLDKHDNHVHQLTKWKNKAPSYNLVCSIINAMAFMWEPSPCSNIKIIKARLNNTAATFVKISLIKIIINPLVKILLCQTFVQYRFIFVE